MTMAKNIGSAMQGLKPVVFMVIYQAGTGGINVFYKLAASDGMKVKILVAYRLIFATAFMTPLALIFERKVRPKLTWKIIIQGFLCGLLGGSLTNNLYAASLILTSATFASAMSNLIPAITFIMAIIFREESLAIGTFAGKAKVFGTILGIGGAMVLTLYKGSVVQMWSTHIELLHGPNPNPSQHQAPGSHILGSLLAIGSCMSSASWLIIQTRLSQSYPCYSSTALMSFMGSIQATVYALSTEKDWSVWKLGWNIRLLATIYAGLVSSGLMIVIAAWCTGKKGPLFVSAFNPLGPIFVVVLGSLFLDEKLHLGSIIGSVLIITGLYIVLWGKSKEMRGAQFSEPECPNEDVKKPSIDDANQPTAAIVSMPCVASYAAFEDV